MRLACVQWDSSNSSHRLSDDALIQIGESLSPRFEFDGSEYLYLDIGIPDNEEECRETIQDRFLKENVQCRVSIASSKKISELAIATSQSSVPLGFELQFLESLPIQLLNPSSRLSEKLNRWGIDTLGALSRLPNGKVATLLGEEGWKLQQAARGVDLVPFTPYRRTPSFSKTMHLEWPILEIEPFMYIANNMLERLILELVALNSACALLDLHLQLDPSGDDERSIRLRSPTRETKTLLELISREMRSRPPRAPISGIEIVLHPDQAREMQLSLFGPPAFSPTRLATTLAQLYALMGPDHVGSPIATDGIRPERWRLSAYDAPPPPLIRDPNPMDIKHWTAIRVLRPSILLHANVDQEWPYRPTHLRSLSKKLFFGSRVLVASGPWKMEERWWTNDSTTRDYWTVELECGLVLRVFSDAKKVWYADGLYD